jgi:hypothetical protein
MFPEIACFSDFPEHFASLPDGQSRGEYSGIVLKQAADVVHAESFEGALISTSKPLGRAADGFVPGKRI